MSFKVKPKSKAKNKREQTILVHHPAYRLQLPVHGRVSVVPCLLHITPKSLSNWGKVGHQRSNPEVLCPLFGHVLFMVRVIEF